MKHTYQSIQVWNEYDKHTVSNMSFFSTKDHQAAPWTYVTKDFEKVGMGENQRIGIRWDLLSRNDAEQMLHFKYKNVLPLYNECIPIFVG